MNDDWRGWKNGKYDNRYHGVRRHSGKSNTGKSIAIIFGGLSVIIIAVLLVGIPGLPKVDLSSFNQSQQSQATIETQSTRQPDTTSSSVTWSNCLMASNGVGGIRINCENHDSVQCVSNPPIGSGIQKDVTLTIDKKMCNVEYRNPQGATTYINFELSSSNNVANTIVKTIEPIQPTNILNTIKNETNNPVITTITNTIKNNHVTDTITKTLTSLQPKPMDMNAIALDIHNLINEQRKANGLQPLTWNPTLSKAALNHSSDMATRNYFEHDDPEGHDFTYRYSQVGFNCQIPVGGDEYSGGGENIMYLDGYYGEENIASQTVTGWMNSAGHRANILTPYFQSEGIGVAQSDNGKIYATEDFC